MSEGDDLFWGGLWWVVGDDGRLRTATPGECCAEILRLRRGIMAVLDGNYPPPHAPFEAPAGRVDLGDDGCCHKTRVRGAACPAGRNCPFDLPQENNVEQRRFRCDYCEQSVIAGPLGPYLMGALLDDDDYMTVCADCYERVTGVRP